MRALSPLCVVSTMIAASPVFAISWGLNSLGDSVYWSDYIVVGQVEKVIKLEKRDAGGAGEPRGHAEMLITVLQQWKGHLPESVSISGVDLGDPTHQTSPFPPLPERLEGHTLFLMLRKTDGGQTFEAYHRGLVEDNTVGSLAFNGVQQKPLEELRSIVEQLQLIQELCPISEFAIQNQSAALAACQAGLHSEYSEVAWYAARRLNDLPIPAHLLIDMIELAKEEKADFPIRYLLVQGIGKSEDPLAARGLIDILRAHPDSHYTVFVLEHMTGNQYGSNLAEWEQWWQGTRDRGNDQSQQKPMGSRPSSTVEVLVDGLDNRHLEANRLAIRALSAMGREAIPALIDALREGNVFVKIGAAKALGQIGRDAAAAVEPLIEALEVRNSNLRATVYRALGRIGEKPDLVVPVLQEALRSEWDFERNAAIQALGELGPNAVPALPALRRLLEDQDRYIREAAEQAIEKIDRES